MIFTADRSHYPSEDLGLGPIAVESYNHRIYAKSDTQIYGSDPCYLASITRLPKDERF